EEGEDMIGRKHPSHAELWVRFSEGLGIARDDILNYEPLPGIRAALEMYVALVQQSHWAVAIGTGLVFEGGGPKRMKEEREALERGARRWPRRRSATMSSWKTRRSIGSRCAPPRSSGGRRRSTSRRAAWET